MTENEAQKWLERFEWDDSEETSEALATICEALQEYPKYRAIGTVEDVAFYKKCYDEESYEYCGEYGTDNCGCKYRMEYLEKKVAELEAIGTIEEFKALKLKEHNYDNCHNYTCRKKCEKDGYAKAIDEFAERLKDSLIHNYRHLLKTDTDGFEWLTTDAVGTHIDEIAEEMRGAV